MTEEPDCPPCAEKHLKMLDEKWLESKGKDLAIEGKIIAQCFKMGIDCDIHMENLYGKMKELK